MFFLIKGDIPDILLCKRMLILLIAYNNDGEFFLVLSTIIFKFTLVFGIFIMNIF